MASFTRKANPPSAEKDFYLNDDFLDVYDDLIRLLSATRRAVAKRVRVMRAKLEGVEGDIRASEGRLATINGEGKNAGRLTRILSNLQKILIRPRIHKLKLVKKVSQSRLSASEHQLFGVKQVTEAVEEGLVFIKNRATWQQYVYTQNLQISPSDSYEKAFRQNAEEVTQWLLAREQETTS